MRRARKILLLIILLNTLFISRSLSAALERAEINAEKISYDRESERVYAQESVEVVYRDMRFTADRIEFNRMNGEISAWGNVNFYQENYSMRSESMVYNIIHQTGSVSSATIFSDPFIVYADSIIIKGQDEFLIPRGDITTCDHYPPHYRFSGSDISLKLNSRLSAWKTILFIRDFPTFYYPYYTKNLGPERLEVSFDIGSSDSAGYYLKTRVSYPFTENSRSYVGVDLMTVKGVGLRLGHNYDSDSGRSRAEAYYIREKDTALRRGSFNLSGWQRLRGDLSLNYRTEYNSHRFFGYEYDRGGGDYARDNLYYQFGADLNRRAYQASVYMDRREFWEDGNYRLSKFTLPGASLTLSPLNLPGRISFSGDTSFRRDYEIEEEYWYSTLTWRGLFRGSYRWDPSRNYYAAFTPGVGYDGVLTEYQNIRHHIRLEPAIRQGFYNRVFLDTSYLWRRELQFPYGILTSRLNSALTLRPLKGLSLSTRGSYDFREGVERPVGDLFFTAEFRQRRHRYYFRNRYSYHDNKTLDWLAEVNLMNISETRLRYNHLYPDRLELTQRFDIRKGDFRIQPGVRMHFEKEPDSFYSFSEFIETSLNLTWDLHCWQTQLRAVNRGSEMEFWILANITAFPESKVGVYGNLRDDPEGLHTDFKFHRE